MRRIILISLILGLLTTPVLAMETITFEEGIPVPSYVLKQYCSSPSYTKGVEFLTSGRLFAPTVETASPSHALMNGFPNCEFCEHDRIVIHFTTGQSAVSVKVGLVSQYPTPITAYLRAYSGDPPDLGHIGNPLAAASTPLGTGPTAITHELSVSSPSADIQTVVIEYSPAAIEAIDDLTFSTAGPTCIDDPTPPTVTILKPTDGQIIQSPYHEELAFEATDGAGGSGIARIQVYYFSSEQDDLSHSFTHWGYWGCGGPGESRCLYTDYPWRVSYDVITNIPVQTKILRVRAWDFVGNTAKADRDLTVIPIGDFNLWVRGMEITQGTQPWIPSNPYFTRLETPITLQYPEPPDSVPLVANRKTVVRVYPGVEATIDSQPLNEAKAELRCYHDDACTIPCSGPTVIYPEHNPPSYKRTVNVVPDEALDNLYRDVNKTFNFVLPVEWTKQGTINLEATVKAPTGLQECDGCQDGANRQRITGITFTEVPGFTDVVYYLNTLRIALINGVPQMGWNLPTSTESDAALRYSEKRLPIDETTMPSQADWWIFYDETTSQDRAGNVLSSLRKTYPDREGKMAVFALLDIDFRDSGLGGGGYAMGRANVPDVLDEEVGHALGLNHAGPTPGHGSNCDETGTTPCAECNGQACDSDWPWPHGTIGANGFDIFEMTPILPDYNGDGILDNNDWHDFMSYGGPADDWVSPRTWIRMFNAITGQDLPYPKKDTSMVSNSVGSEITSVSTQSSTSVSKYLVVSGEQSLDGSGSWILHPFYEMDLPSGTADDEGSGEYSIVLLKADGTETFTRWFSPMVIHMAVDTSEDTSIRTNPFVELIPLSDGVTRVEIRQGSEVLVFVNRSEHSPQVEISSPTTDGFTGQPSNPKIQWTSSDDDGDSLVAMIQYSTGSSEGSESPWETLAIDVPGQELPVFLENLKGSEEARIRVLVTDGWNTGVAVSPAFPVSDKAPVAKIIDPPSGITLEYRDRLTLSGSGSDLEDGLLESRALHWSSSLDSDLGSGRKIDVNLLSIGTHTISLIAMDKMGQVGVDTIRVTVVEPMNIQPIADAGPDLTTGVGVPVSLNAEGSYDDNRDPLSWSWSIADSPAGSHPTLSSASSTRPDFSADVVGDYDIPLVVSDGKVDSISDHVIIHVIGNQPPVADPNGPYEVDENTSVTFDGSGSTDPDDGDSIVSYEWDLDGDDIFESTGVNPTYTWCDDYEGTVTLRVTDKEGAQDTASTPVAVRNVAPAVTLDAPDQPNPQFILPYQTLTFRGTFTDPGCDEWDYTWDFGDGTETATDHLTEIVPILTTHVFGAPGDYAVSITVEDDEKDRDTETVSVHVADVVEAKEDLAAYIQGLPADAFVKSKNEVQQKAAFANMFVALDDMIADEEWNGFATSITSNVRSKADGKIDGKTNDDWIKSQEAQEHICMKIDDIVAYVQTFL